MEAELLDSAAAFVPELILCAFVVGVLLARLLGGRRVSHLGWMALLGTVVALVVSCHYWGSFSEEHTIKSSGEVPLFGGLLIHDSFTTFLRIFLFAFTALVILLTLMTGIPDQEDSADFYCLLLGATLGMSIMASANHLLMVYIGVEMASLPSYALAGFLKGRRQSSEASLKYVVYGGGASGVMLFGISLLAGKFGTGYLPDLAKAYAAFLHVLPTDLSPLVLLLGTIFIFIGLAFKLAAFPFHFWCPDVFEGASAEVAGFLSVASKGAALALTARLVMVLAGLDRPARMPVDQWLEVVRYLAPVLAGLAALTATFGNLAAYLQTNMKRLLAYSTIAHAGYMMMGLAPISAEGTAAVLFYLIAYLVMNLGAFAVVAFIRNKTGSEDLSSYRGLIRRSPWLTVTLSIFLLSLLGIPPLGGFAAKFQIFSALYHAGQGFSSTPGGANLGLTMYALLVIGGLNTVVSAVYYVKVMKVMIVDKPLEEIENRPSEPIGESLPWRLYASGLAVLTVVVMVLMNPLVEASVIGVNRFARGPKPGDAPAVVQKAEAK
jgi:NADH-quinone oxidoreductase subunit N